MGLRERTIPTDDEYRSWRESFCNWGRWGPDDEFGTLNLVVPPPVYERDRLAVRSEPLVIADGRLERYASAGGAINFVVRRLRALEVPMGEIAEVHDFIRETLARRFGPDTAAGIRLLYGGSVKPANAAAIFTVPNVDGALVGGASLKADDFAAIIAAAS